MLVSILLKSRVWGGPQTVAVLRAFEALIADRRASGRCGHASNYNLSTLVRDGRGPDRRALVVRQLRGPDTTARPLRSRGRDAGISTRSGAALDGVRNPEASYGRTAHRRSRVR